MVSNVSPLGLDADEALRAKRSKPLSISCTKHNYVLGFVVVRDVVKVFPVSSSSFVRKSTGRNQARSQSGA